MFDLQGFSGTNRVFGKIIILELVESSAHWWISNIAKKTIVGPPYQSIEYSRPATIIGAQQRRKRILMHFVLSFPHLLLFYWQHAELNNGSTMSTYSGSMGWLECSVVCIKDLSVPRQLFNVWFHDRDPAMCGVQNIW